jgi:hypothetical protein
MDTDPGPWIARLGSDQCETPRKTHSGRNRPAQKGKGVLPRDEKHHKKYCFRIRLPTVYHCRVLSELRCLSILSTALELTAAQKFTSLQAIPKYISREQSSPAFNTGVKQQQNSKFKSNDKPSYLQGSGCCPLEFVAAFILPSDNLASSQKKPPDRSHRPSPWKAYQNLVCGLPPRAPVADNDCGCQRSP